MSPPYPSSPPPMSMSSASKGASPGSSCMERGSSRSESTSIESPLPRSGKGGSSSRETADSPSEPGAEEGRASEGVKWEEGGSAVTEADKMGN